MTIKVVIEKLVFEGKGLGHDSDGRAVFVKRSVPGDELEIEVTKEKKNFKEGTIKSIIKPSPLRIAPKCPHFDRCGGCEHQNIAYSDQLKLKDDIFKEVINRANIVTEVLPIIAGSASEFYYRNTQRFFVAKKCGQYSFAMHDYADFTELISIKECYLQSETCNKILSAILSILNKAPIRLPNGKEQTYSNISQLRLREGKSTGEFMLEFITKSEQFECKAELIEMLKSNFPVIKSCYQTVSYNDSLIGARRKLLFGSPIIYEKIGKFTFQISPESFFQTNSCGIKTLYDKIKEFADIKVGDNIIDLFCGTGTIGIYLSTLAKSVIGVELVQNAVNDAKANARINHMANTEFICCDTTKWLKDNSAANKLDNSTIIIDPPRQGLAQELICEIAKLKIKSCLYVSCDPATFARDIAEFEKNGLRLKKVQPVDMFPQTHHIECIGLLSC